MSVKLCIHVLTQHHHQCKQLFIPTDVIACARERNCLVVGARKYLNILSIGYFSTTFGVQLLNRWISSGPSTWYIILKYIFFSLHKNTFTLSWYVVCVCEYFIFFYSCTILLVFSFIFIIRKERQNTFSSAQCSWSLTFKSWRRDSLRRRISNTLYFFSLTFIHSTKNFGWKEKIVV